MHYCKKCDKDFVSAKALADHRTNSPVHYMCLVCNREFVSPDGRKAHYAAKLDHHYCKVCDLLFKSDAKLETHLEELHIYCRVCDTFFSSQEAKDQIHAEKPHFYCISCPRGFKTENNLIHHTRTHLPKSIRCPGKKCKRSFALPADLVHHMESGVCCLTRHDIDRAVIAYDRARVITDASRLILGPDGSYAKPAVVQEWATTDSWNGTAFECVVCHRTFRQLGHLNDHLDSPTHADEIYKCPTAYEGCGTQFGTLSALVQHVEIATCGVSKFQRHVHTVVDHISSGMRGLRL